MNYQSPYRKRLTGVFLLASAVALPALADYKSTVLSQGPVGYWRLNETTAPSAPPIIANNLGSLGGAANGVYSNTCFPGALPGAIAGDPANGAALFPSVDTANRVRIPYAAQWNANAAFSVEFWAKPGQTNTTVSPGASTVFTSTTRSGWLFYQADPGLVGGGGWNFRLYVGSAPTGTANKTIGLAMTLDTTKWYHVVGVYDGAGNMTLYVNGAPVATGNLPDVYRFVTDTTAPMTFGNRSDGASAVGGYFPYNGLVDEAAFYSAALSAGQVLTHYQAGTNAAVNNYKSTIIADSPAGYWRFSESGQPPAANLGTLGAAANGFYVYNASPNQTGPNPSSAPTAFPGFEGGNTACGFDGTSGSVSIPALNLNTNTITVTCWMYPNGSQQPVAGVFNNQGPTGSAGLQFSIGGGLMLGYNWNNTGVGFPSFLNVNDSQWNFVSLMIQPDKAILFVPGQPAVTNFSANPAVPFDGLTFIGGSPTTNKFNGIIDEVALFNRSLSLGEAFDQYADAVGSQSPQIFQDPGAPADGVYVGDTLTLVVDAGGSSPLSYQWRKDSSPISGATSSVYSKANVTAGDSGTYDVVVTNPYGNPTSLGVPLTITSATAPNIISSFSSRLLYPKGTLNLNVVATGGGLKYQWKHSGTNLPGATTSAYVVASVTTNYGGPYSLTVSNTLGVTNLGPATITIPALQAGTYAAVVSADAPEAWWRLDESAGTSGNGSPMYDAMGRHDGYYTNLGNGSITLGNAGAISGGIPGTAAHFNGTNSFGFAPFSTALNGRAFSLECWARMSSVVNGVVPASSFSDTEHKGYGFDSQTGNWYGFIGSGGVDYIFGQNAHPATGNTNWNPAILAGQWMHLVITCAPSGSFPLQIYLNGATDGFIWGDFDRNPDAPFIIGGLGTGDGNVGTRYFIGDVDEVAVYNQALTPAQIQAHYAAASFGVAPFFLTQPVSRTVPVGASITMSANVSGSTPISLQWYKNGVAFPGGTNSSLPLPNVTNANSGTYVLWATNSSGVSNSAPATLTVYPQPTYAYYTNGLVLHLKFDGNYSDSSGRGHNGTAVGAPTIVGGKIGTGALHFQTATDTGASGGNVTEADYITLGNPADFSFGAGTDFTIAYWARLPAGSTNGDLPFLCSATNSFGNLGITIAPSYKLGGWSWFIGDSPTTGAGLYGPNNSINDGNWHHLVHSFHRTGTCDTSLDGVLVNSTSIAGLGSIDSGETFSIGQDPTGLYSEPGSADIDDLGIWRRALNEYEAYAIYHVGQNNGYTFDVAPVIKTTRIGNTIQLTWPIFNLQSAPAVIGPWTPVPGATSPYTVPTGSGAAYYRLAAP
jgi:hypothetical protein